MTTSVCQDFAKLFFIVTKVPSKPGAKRGELGGSLRGAFRGHFSYYGQNLGKSGEKLELVGTAQVGGICPLTWAYAHTASLN